MAVIPDLVWRITSPPGGVNVVRKELVGGRAASGELVAWSSDGGQQFPVWQLPPLPASIPTSHLSASFPLSPTPFSSCPRPMPDWSSPESPKLRVVGRASTLPQSRIFGPTIWWPVLFFIRLGRPY